MILYPRSSWTATAPGFTRYPGRLITPSRVSHLRLHYPGDGAHTRAHYTREQSEQALRNYRAFHINTRGWADIGYPLAVDMSGRAFVAAGTTHAAAHSATSIRPNENWHSLAFLLIIGNNEKPSPAMIATVNELWAGLLDGSLGLGEFPNMLTVTAHRDVPGATTRCAGDQVAQLLRDKAFRASRTSPEAPAPTAPTTFLEKLMAQNVYVFFEQGDGQYVANLLDGTYRQFPSTDITNQFAEQLRRHEIPWAWHAGNDPKGPKFVADPTVFGRKVPWS